MLRRPAFCSEPSGLSMRQETIPASGVCRRKRAHFSRAFLLGTVSGFSRRKRSAFLAFIPWLQALDVFVLPSYANEGVPQAVLQAMACGLPVVTTPVGSIGEAVKDEETGLVVEPHCSQCLSAAIERLMSSPDLRKKLGLSAIHFVRANFGINRMLDRMEAVFQENRALP